MKEWKLPDSKGYDKKTTHRHLSHLVGWFPGYSIASFDGGYSNATIQKAIAATLDARGDGSNSDCNCGWSKVWRAACWARLNATEKAYDELRLTIQTNLAANGLSMYSGKNAPFQIDANPGFGGAVLSMLVVDLPLRYSQREVARTVVLGPAIPTAWGGGSVAGLRLRGGGSVDFTWDETGLVTNATLKGRTKPLVLADRSGRILTKV